MNNATNKEVKATFDENDNELHFDLSPDFSYLHGETKLTDMELRSVLKHSLSHSALNILNYLLFHNAIKGSEEYLKTSILARRYKDKEISFECKIKMLIDGTPTIAFYSVEDGKRKPFLSFES